MGVRKEAIIEDYLLTNDFYKGPVISEDWRDSRSEILKPLFEARVDYINAAFNEIYSRHKKVEDFILNELYVSSKTIDTMKSKILE